MAPFVSMDLLQYFINKIQDQDITMKRLELTQIKSNFLQRSQTIMTNL
jgi:hypothetical protein